MHSNRPPFHVKSTGQLPVLRLCSAMVARSSAANLPDSYPGLQMVDIILWNDADPDQLRDISQMQALVD